MCRAVQADAARGLKGQRVKQELSLDDLNRAADAAIADYVEECLDGLEGTAKQTLRDAVAGLDDAVLVKAALRKALDDVFSPARAEMVAVTETTRLFGLGSQAAYRAMGLEQWTWRTAEDERVDGECGALGGKQFPIEEPFSPAHPRCRCWPAPGV